MRFPQLLSGAAASLLLMLLLAGQARAAQIDWVRQFGTAGLDEMYGTAADPNSMYAVGRAEGALPDQSFAGSSDAVLRKYSASGAELWTREFGTAGRDVAQSVALGPAGTVYIVGAAAGSISGQLYAGGTYDV